MTEFAKIAAVAKMWGWGRTWTALAILLLSKHIVTFDQALILLLLNLLFEEFVYGKRPFAQLTLRSSSVPAKKRRGQTVTTDQGPARANRAAASRRRPGSSKTIAPSRSAPSPPR